MAHMYPCIKEKLVAPTSEQLVYDELSKLPDTYTVFHSVHWIKKNPDRNFTWYENDYLILNKTYGMLFLEVKGGHCYFKNGLMYQQNLLTKEIKILDEGNDPLNQAQRGIQHFRKIIQKTALKYNGKISIEPIVWFPACTFDPRQNLPTMYHEASFAILDSNAFSANSGVSLESRLKKIYETYGSVHNTSLTDDQMEWIKNTIAPDFDLIPSPSIVKTEIDNAFIRLTNEQSVLLDYIAEQKFASIQGAAGTGKTLIAQMAAKRFAEQGRKVLFLCYNNLLYNFLKSNNQVEGISYYNADTFATDYCKDIAGSVENRMHAYKALTPDNFEYDDIIIDEGQDLGNEEILFFKDLFEKREGHCFIFYDKNQVVTYDKSSRDTDSMPKWIQESECRLLLSQNCRNTKSIAKTSYSIIDYNVIQKVNNIVGDRPTIIFENKQPFSKLGDLIKFYISKGYTEDEITILSMTTEDKSFLQGKMISSYKLKSNTEDSGILFTTARKFKGLENKVIIIIDIDERCFALDAIKKVFYVACSRAMHQLTLFVNGDNSTINKMADALSGKTFSPKGKIIQKTKTCDFIWN